MVDRSRYVISRGYGKCIEAMAGIDEQLTYASIRKDPAKVAILMEDRAAWLQLAEVTPRFVHEVEAARHG